MLPPTRANKACVLAPMPKVSMVVVIMHSLAVGALASEGMKASSRRYQKEMSRSPRPTTTSPITAPLRNAMRKPLLSDSRAALAVRAEAYVAVFMPRKPDNPEKKPPVRNATGTHEFCRLKPYAMTANKAHRTRNTMPTTLYCCFR